MNVSDAAYVTVHDYPGGAQSLAPRAGMNPTVLCSKVNPNTGTHHLTLAEALRIQAMTGDHRICSAMNMELGYLPPIKRVDVVVGDMALLESYTQMLAELGDFSRAFNESLRDGKVTRAELSNMRQQMMEFFAAGEEIMARAEQLVED